MTEHPIPRREFLGACLAAGACAGAGDGGGARSLAFRLKETAGLRRFGYPVHTRVPLDPIAGPYRLERGGAAVPAQFRAVDGPGGEKTLALDFNASPGPLEAESYTVRAGKGVEPGPEPKEGIRVEHVGHGFRVANGTVLTYRLADHRPGFFSSVNNGGVEFVSGSQGGLSMTGKDGQLVSLGDLFGDRDDFRATVTRDGPMAVGLRFEGTTGLPGGGKPRSVIDLTFPNSKSWVELSWIVDDTDGDVVRMGASFGLKVDGLPVSLDFGASNTVYGHVRAAEWMWLQAGDAPGFPPRSERWSVGKGTASATSTFARSASNDGPPAEGWAHVMDRTRCTAVAVADFGRGARDEISASSGGVLVLSRRFAGPRAQPPKAPKSLRFWLHFVTNPVQVGAVTSPQAMLAPLEVAWER